MHWGEVTPASTAALHRRPARPLPSRTRSLGAFLRANVHCLRERCSQRSVPEIQEKNLRMRALREFPCKGSSWLWLIPWFCNTYNMYVWGGHTEYIVPLPMFKYYFIPALNVVITVCIQSEIILVQSPRSRFKQKSRTWIQIQMLGIETILLMIFYELTLLGMCLWYVREAMWYVYLL